MCFSAIRSRCAVETPGFSSDSTSASTSPTIRPALRIFSISALDLRVTMSGVLARHAGRRGRDDLIARDELGQQVIRDAVDRLRAIDGVQDTGATVMINNAK